MRTTISILIFICAVSCGPSTEITGSWKNARAENATKKPTSILVAAMTDKANVRQTVEEDLTAALSKAAVRTMKSIDVMPPTFSESGTVSKEELLAKIKDTGVDAILTTALIDKETENRYVPGGGPYGYQPFPQFGYYGMFWGYYQNWSPALLSPGYYRQDKIYFIETNLYDAHTQELLWSAQSETMNPSDLKSFSREFARVMVVRMKQDKIL